MVSSVLVMEMVAMLLATCSHATASGSSAAVLLAGDYTSTNAGRLHRLRGGFEAVMPLKPANLGTPNQWAGMNFGPKERRMNYLHSKARPLPKVQSRWYIDCSRPVSDKLLDIVDLERFLRENLKVQGKTGNLMAGKNADQPRVVVYAEKQTRLIMQSYIPVAKRYIKYLIKNYLHKRGLRDFVWCVSAGKASYKLKYYNIEELKAAASAPSHPEASAPQMQAAAAATTAQAPATEAADEESAAAELKEESQAKNTEEEEEAEEAPADLEEEGGAGDEVPAATPLPSTGVE